MVYWGSNSCWHAKKVLKWFWPSMNQSRLIYIQNSNTISELVPQVERYYWFCMKNNGLEIIGHQLPKGGFIKFKKSSNVPKQLFEICSLLPLCPGCKDIIHLPQTCYDILTSSPIGVQGSSILDLLLRSWIWVTQSCCVHNIISYWITVTEKEPSYEPFECLEGW